MESGGSQRGRRGAALPLRFHLRLDRVVEHDDAYRQLQKPIGRRRQPLFRIAVETNGIRSALKTTFCSVETASESKMSWTSETLERDVYDVIVGDVHGTFSCPGA